MLTTATVLVLAMAIIGGSSHAKDLSPRQKKDAVGQLLKSLESKDSKALAYINPDQYIQHNLQIENGLPGLKKLIAGLPSDTKVNIVRTLADGDFVVTHAEYNFFGPKVGFDIFRFQNGSIVEHWDNLEAKCEQPNASGRTQTDGPTEIKDLDKTEANKALLKEYFEVVVIGGHRDQASRFRGNFHQHNCFGEDNKSGAQATSGPFAKPGFVYKVNTVHRILGEGNFVLVVNEGIFDSKPAMFYDFYRVANNMIVEHWDVIEAIPPVDQWKNKNGKF
jgi:predicted SnoaL-like aldol condensation-catalyzing enzyme